MAAVAAILTLAVVFLPGIAFAYRNPRLHIAIDTADAVIALLAAFLLFGRFGRSRRLRDLLLVNALLIFGLGNMFLSALPTTVTGGRIEDLSTWGPLVTRTIGGVFLTGAAVANRRLVALPRHAGIWALVNSAVIVLLVAGIVIALEGVLPQAVETTGPGDALRPDLDGHPMVLVLHLLLMAMFAVAAFMFTAAADRDDDELMRWFGAGAVVAAFARLNYVLYPSLYSDYVYTGDFFRLCFYLLLLIGAGREIASYWSELSETAVTEERRRMARDLHDGLAQELAFMWSDIQVLRREHPDDDKVTRASGSAERALDESRRAIAAFTRPPQEPLDVAIESFIEEVARRLDVRVRLDLEPDIAIAGKLREDLLRVVREAVTNAARHGQADTITVRLWRDGALRLEISDDGVGFEPDSPHRAESFGIISMKERVGNHGGELNITSAPGVGTVVEVMLP